MYDALDAAFPYEEDFYKIDGFRVFPGIEVDIAETGHILLIGRREEIRSVRAELEEHTEEENFIPFKSLLDATEDRGLLRIGAHPFRVSTPLHPLEAPLLARLDDLNAKDLYAAGEDAYMDRLVPFAAGLGKPIVAGSDTHQSLQYGSVWNELNDDVRTIGELRAAVSDGRYIRRVSPCLRTKVKAAKMVKKLSATIVPPFERCITSARRGNK
ncbi:PHP-associated domain-containing protein [Paenibacillus beijingensis]|uniref:PHP-associated domain-containing protein n=1 Tax=Paenibacillus beijingensis TaxID=1126833 RepID=UPI000A87E605|nr:PHP-associated domain-containing protein [Paenibacillus beijingensis]